MKVYKRIYNTSSHQEKESSLKMTFNFPREFHALQPALQNRQGYKKKKSKINLNFLV